MRHVEATAAALATHGRCGDPDQVDCGKAADQVIGDADRHAALAVIDRDQHRYTRTHPRLCIINQSAQVFGIQSVDHLPDEANASYQFRASRCIGLAATAQRQGFLRLGQFAFEPFGLVNQGRDPGRDLVRPRFQDCGGTLQAALLLGQEQPRRLPRQRLNTPDA